MRYLLIAISVILISSLSNTTFAEPTVSESLEWLNKRVDHKNFSFFLEGQEFKVKLTFKYTPEGINVYERVTSDHGDNDEYESFCKWDDIYSISDLKFEEGSTDTYTFVVQTNSKDYCHISGDKDMMKRAKNAITFIAREHGVAEEPW